MEETKKDCNIADRVLCLCPKKKFLGEDLKEGKVLCSCGNMNDLSNEKYYPNKLSASYQSKLQSTLKKKGT